MGGATQTSSAAIRVSAARRASRAAPERRADFAADAIGQRTLQGRRQQLAPVRQRAPPPVTLISPIEPPFSSSTSSPSAKASATPSRTASRPGPRRWSRASCRRTRHAHADRCAACARRTDRAGKTATGAEAARLRRLDQARQVGCADQLRHPVQRARRGTASPPSGASVAGGSDRRHAPPAPDSGGSDRSPRTARRRCPATGTPGPAAIDAHAHGARRIVAATAGHQDTRQISTARRPRP